MEFTHSTLAMKEATNNQVTSGHRKRASLGIGISALALVLLVALLHGIHLVSPKSIETAIDQNLGPESDLTSVRQFMDAHHILYTGYSPELHCAYGKIYRSSIGLQKGYIFIEFTFNEDGKLASYKVLELFEFAWE